MSNNVVPLNLGVTQPTKLVVQVCISLKSTDPPLSFCCW